MERQGLASHAGPALGPRAGRAAALRERWRALRNHLVASPRFQRWAAGFPLTRGIARRNTRALFDLCAGFVYAQILTACVRLDLFRILSEGPLPVDVLARRLGLPPGNALRLLRAAASLRLLAALPDGRFALADLGAALVGNPSVAAMIEHHALFYADLADPVALLRGEAGPTRLAGYWPYADRTGFAAPDAAVAPYSGLMAASQALIAEDVLDAYPLDRHAGLLDVGGGEGAFVAEAARRHPSLRLALLDLPPVAERARKQMAEQGLGERVACSGGSFLDGIGPADADAISLIRIVHDHDDDHAARLLAGVQAALPPGGTILLAEPMAGTPGAEPVGDAYFGFYLLAMGSGRPRDAATLAGMLTAAGFVDIRERRTRRPMLVRVLTARRGADTH